jgi:hypothetical protein
VPSHFASSHISLANLGSAVGKLMSTPTGFSALASIQGVVVTVRLVTGVSATLGDTVLLTKYYQSWFVIGVVEDAPVVPPPPSPTPPSLPPTNRPVPPPKAPNRSGRLIVAPVATATYRDGKWRTDVTGGVTGGDTLQGVYPGYGNNTGCAFYGTKPRSLAGATVTLATIRVRRLRAGSFAARTTTLRLVTQATRPGGAPTLGASTSGPSLAVDRQNDHFVVPDAWAQAMVDGTAGGLAIFTSSGSPYVRLAGRAAWSPAWTLTINWQR